MAAPARSTVVAAPDSFKGSLPADQAAAAVAAGARAAGAAAGVEVEVRARPVADGGEGTVAVVLAAGWEARNARVSGPTGEPVSATFAMSPAGVSPRTAVVELAEASGLHRLPGGRFDPLGASTYGTGETVTAALDAGAERVVLGIGGSATTDGGAGLAAALGARFLDRGGNVLGPGGGALAGLAGIDVSGLDPRLRTTEVVVASDVDNPLTGPRGAAHVYGPQKGADADHVERLDAGLRRLAEVLRRDLGADVEQAPGAGAAGGVGAAALAFLRAELVPGIDLLLDVTRFDEALDGADLVVSGEGSLDGQSLSGKAPVGVARRAFAAGVPVLLLAGRVELDDTARAAFRDLGVVDIRALLELEPDPAVAVRDAAPLLAALTERALTDVPALRPVRSHS